MSPKHITAIKWDELPSLDAEIRDAISGLRFLSEQDNTGQLPDEIIAILQHASALVSAIYGECDAIKDESLSLDDSPTARRIHTRADIIQKYLTQL